MNKIKEFWNKLTPTGKKRLLWVLIFAGLALVTTVSYKASRKTEATRTSSDNKKISMTDSKILEISEKMSIQAQLARQQELMEKLRRGEITKEEFDKEMQALNQKISVNIPKNEQNQQQNIASSSSSQEQNENIKLPQLSSNTINEQKAQQKTQNQYFSSQKEATQKIDDIPEPLDTNRRWQRSSRSENTEDGILKEPLAIEGEGKKPVIEYVGDIGIVSHTPTKEIKNVDDKKKQKETIYLPSSFMEATLLSGLDAPTVEAAKGNPMLTLLRVKDLAVLPNHVKANLKGCFAVAEGYGSLSDERAHLRLVSLSCIDKKGRAIIDQKVKGYVVDTDGKIGLRGKVVAKMGSMIARSFLAGFLGGFGDAVKQSSTTNLISPTGTTSVLNTDQSFKAGLGSGIAQAATELQKFYMELARQTMPVIEIGATRNVTLVISEGVELEIKEINSGGQRWQ